MSGASYSGSAARLNFAYEKATTESKEERSGRLKGMREEAAKAPPPPKVATPRRREKVNPQDVVRFTKPDEAAKELHLVLIDNSGSNSTIAKHLRGSTGYLLSTLNAFASTSQIGFIFFSDHCDAEKIRQDVGWVYPSPEGERRARATLEGVYEAGGGDAPEAIECILAQACDINFGHLQKPQCHLYLVTDVLAHGMGMHGDDGCPLNVDWKQSVKRVHQLFGTVNVIGCSYDPRMATEQRKFLKNGREEIDIIDLSSIKEQEYRLGIVGNALLFLIARTCGLQTTEFFLKALYEKWLSEPLFGANTDINAQEAIRRFGKYIEADPQEVQQMLDRVLPL